MNSHRYLEARPRLKLAVSLLFTLLLAANGYRDFSRGAQISLLTDIACAILGLYSAFEAVVKIFSAPDQPTSRG